MWWVDGLLPRGVDAVWEKVIRLSAQAHPASTLSKHMFGHVLVPRTKPNNTGCCGRKQAFGIYIHIPRFSCQEASRLTRRPLHSLHHPNHVLRIPHRAFPRRIPFRASVPYADSQVCAVVHTSESHLMVVLSLPKHSISSEFIFYSSRIQWITLLAAASRHGGSPHLVPCVPPSAL